MLYICVVFVNTYHSFQYHDRGKNKYVGRTADGTGTEIILIEALSHLARSALRTSPYTKIGMYLQRTSPNTNAFDG